MKFILFFKFCLVHFLFRALYNIKLNELWTAHSVNHFLDYYVLDGGFYYKAENTSRPLSAIVSNLSLRNPFSFSIAIRSLLYYVPINPYNV